MIKVHNESHIHFQDLQLELTARVRRPLWFKVWLLSANATAYLSVLLAYGVVATEETALLLTMPFAAMLTAVFMTLTRYTLWAVWGSETLLVSTTAISLQRNYVWWRTPPLRFAFRQLSAVIKADDDIGRLQFFDHRNGGRTVALLATSIPIPKEQLDAFVRKLHVLFFFRHNQPVSNPKVLLN